MKKNLFILIYSICILSFPSLKAQEGNNAYQEDTHFIYKNEASGGIHVHSKGWGVFFRRGYNMEWDKKLIYEGDLIGMKHPKEIKTSNPYFDNAKPYIYGKQNVLLLLRSGIGMQRIISRKPGKGAIEVRYNYSGGLSLGITKPIYLDVLIPTGVPYEFIVTTEKYDPLKQYTDNIYGRAAFTNGLDELGLHPGIYGKVGFSFEYGTYDVDIKAIEAGVAVDMYPKNIPIMALTDNPRIFVTFYVNITPYGKRW